MTCVATHKTSRTILATPRAIFRTLLDAETIPAWKASRGISIYIEHFEPRLGGFYRMALLSPGQERGSRTAQTKDVIIDGRFIEILPHERIVETVQFDTGTPGGNAVMTLTTVLEPLKDGTKVTLIAEGMPPGFDNDGHCAEMDLTLRNLANFVE